MASIKQTTNYDPDSSGELRTKSQTPTAILEKNRCQY